MVQCQGKTIAVGIVVCLGICACSSGPLGGPSKHSSHKFLAKQKSSKQNNLDTTSDLPAGELLKQATVASSSGTEQAPSEPEQQAAQPEPEAQSAAPQLPAYNPSRLKEAGQIKGYSGINVPGTDTNCFVRTKWSNGQVFLRLAILGSQPGVEQFVFGTREFKIRFSDATGAQMNEYKVAGEDVTRAPTSVNNGVPTYQFDSSADCSLEEYEQYRQWSIAWEFRS